MNKKDKLDDLERIDNRLQKIMIYQYRMDIWRKNFHRRYKDKLKECIEKGGARIAGVNVSKNKTKEEENETSSEHNA